MTPPPPDSAIFSAGPGPTRGRRPPRHERPGGAIEATDGELLILFERHGDSRALGRLVARHAPMVWRVCVQVLRHSQDAEDAFQATFLLLARRARSVRAEESAAGWLYRVARRTAISARRRALKRKEQALEEEPAGEPEAAFPDLVGRQTVGVMMEELDALPSKYRTPLVLRYLEGESRRAIAERTDSTVASVQGRLARGKQLLRRRLIRRGVSLAAAMGVVGAASTHAAPPTRLISQTTADASALVHGGSVAASASVLTLYHEGTRAMFISAIAKPLGAAACVAAALMLVVPSVLMAEDGESPSEALVLVADADAPADQPNPVRVAQADRSGVLLTEAYHVPDFFRDDEGASMLVLMHELGVLLHAEGGEGSRATPYVEGNSVVVVADPETHELVAQKIAELRYSTPPRSETTSVKEPEPPVDEKNALATLPMQELQAMREYLISTINVATDNEPGLWDFLPNATPEQIAEHFPGKAGQIVADAWGLVQEIDRQQAPAQLNQAERMLAEVRAKLHGGASDDSGEGELTITTDARPTPENGTVMEQWPSGGIKSESEYEDGRLILAIEYAEDGSKLYEYVDKGAKAKEEASNQQTTMIDVSALLTGIGNRDQRLMEELADLATGVDQQGRVRVWPIVESRMLAVSAPKKELTQVHNLILELKQLRESSQNEIRELKAKERARKNAENPMQTQVRQQAAQLIQLRDRLVQKKAELEQTPGVMEKEGAVYGRQKLEHTIGELNKRIAVALAHEVDLEVEAVHMELSKIESLTPDYPELSQPRLTEVKRSTSTSTSRASGAASQQSTRHTGGVSDWEVTHHPSTLNPYGWITEAELYVNGSAPILLPNDERPRPMLTVKSLEGGAVTLRIDDKSGPRDGDTIDLAPGQPVIETIHGQRVELLFRGVVSGRGDLALASLLIRHAPGNLVPPPAPPLDAGDTRTDEATRVHAQSNVDIDNNTEEEMDVQINVEDVVEAASDTEVSLEEERDVETVMEVDNAETVVEEEVVEWTVAPEAPLFTDKEIDQIVDGIITDPLSPMRRLRPDREEIEWIVRHIASSKQRVEEGNRYGRDFIHFWRLWTDPELADLSRPERYDEVLKRLKASPPPEREDEGDYLMELSSVGEPGEE